MALSPPNVISSQLFPQGRASRFEQLPTRLPLATRHNIIQHINFMLQKRTWKALFLEKGNSLPLLWDVFAWRVTRSVLDSSSKEFVFRIRFSFKRKKEFKVIESMETPLPISFKRISKPFELQPLHESWEKSCWKFFLLFIPLVFSPETWRKRYVWWKNYRSR